MLKLFFARSFRVLLVAWLAFVGAAAPTAIAPLVRSAFKVPELTYGFVTSARQSPLFGKVLLEVNDDSGTDFLLWPGRHESKRLLTWLDGSTPYEIWSVPVGAGKRLIVDIQGYEGGVDAFAMDKFQTRMLLFGSLLTVLAWGSLWISVCVALGALRRRSP